MKPCGVIDPQRTGKAFLLMICAGGPLGNATDASILDTAASDKRADSISLMPAQAYVALCRSMGYEPDRGVVYRGIAILIHGSVSDAEAEELRAYARSEIDWAAGAEE